VVLGGGKTDAAPTSADLAVPHTCSQVFAEFVLEHDPVIRLISVPDRILWLVLARWMEPHDFIATVPDVRFAVLGVRDLLSYVEAMVAHGGCLQWGRGSAFRSRGCVGTETSARQRQRKPKSSAPQNRKARAAIAIAGPSWEKRNKICSSMALFLSNIVYDGSVQKYR
jgi:hypothetical protein